MQARFSHGSLAVAGIAGLWLAAISTAAATAGTSEDRADAALPAWIARYAALLEQHTESVPSVVGTTVAYPALLEPPAAAAWQNLLAELAATAPPRTRAETLALWINAYNILAIDVVLRHWPVESIRDVGGLLRSVFELDAGTVAGQKVTLDEIEHEILRPLGDPRIHAAIVCASISCPSLARTPFTPAGIDAELDRSMRRFLSNSDKGLRIEREANRIRVSRIFAWFEGDFARLGGVRGLLSRYAGDADRAWLAGHGADADLAYFRYDWSLNGAR